MLPKTPTGLMSATGGSVSTTGNYRIHTFTSSGTFTVTAAGNAELLVIGAGGGGNISSNGGIGGSGIFIIKYRYQ